MAIRLIKEVINNKGYVINSKDREIFQQGDLQSFFGISDSDAIEFILFVFKCYKLKLTYLCFFNDFVRACLTQIKGCSLNQSKTCYL